MGTELGMVNAYEMLGISSSATLEEIRSAYRTKALLFHPDRGGKVEGFLSLKRAYQILVDPHLRELMGEYKQFERLPLRIQPSLSSATTILFENIQRLQDKLKVK